MLRHLPLFTFLFVDPLSLLAAINPPLKPGVLRLFNVFVPTLRHIHSALSPLEALYLLLNHFQPEITMDAQGKNEVRGGRLLALEGLRAFAAIHIVLYHITPETNDAWGNFVSWGGSQLTLFFSLSGFILAYRYGNQDMNVRQFLINRFSRIYPLLWLSIALILPILKYGIDYQLSTVLSV
jgi:hypothetical protein